MRRTCELQQRPGALRLPDATLARLDRVGDRLDVTPSQVLCDGTTRVRWVWLVVEGALLVEGGGSVDTVGAGEQWGAAQVLEHDDRPYIVTAIANSELVALPEREFLALLGTDGSFGLFVSHQLAAVVARVA